MKTKSIKRIGLSVLILAGIVFIGFKLFNRKVRVNNPIPTYAEALISLDYVNIRNTLLSNYLFDSQGDLENPFLVEFQKSGLKIPNYVIGFTCSDENSVGFFTSFEIENKALFQSYVDSLTEKANYRKTDSTGFIFSSLKGKLFFFYDSNKSKVVISTGINLKEKLISKVFQDVLNETNLLQTDHQLFTQIKTSSNHGLIWFGKGKRIEKESWLTINLEKNELKLEGDIFLKEAYRFKEMNDYVIARHDCQIGLDYRGCDSPFLNELMNVVDKEKFKKITNFSIDSLVEYSHNSLRFDYWGTEIKTDTSLTYEYDDNFNKVEKIAITQTRHPQFELKIDGEGDELFNYLLRDSCIKPIDYYYVFTSFPFSEVYANPDNGLRLTTFPMIQYLDLTMPQFLEFHADFKEIDTNLLDQFGIRNRMLDNKSINLLGFQIGETTTIKGSLKFN